ncbi:DNA topoisomerase VI subunit B [Candidatus Woesearchaeota archaeon]|nr:MAG: DNA topoisomerase VI subunit B [Candidatus Woesearchaeota archaeon]
MGKGSSLRGSTAEEMAKKQREIGVAEFFSRNRHLLGFDNKRKALLTTVKEAVDNSLDACEEAGILPEINIELIDMGNDRFRVIVEDNGPGIVKDQIPKIFAKLLYGSKFHSLKQSRGQQGIGISASVMYGQLTTGKPARITSRTSPSKPAHHYELLIDTQKNQPKILKDLEVNWHKEHGTRVEIDLEGSYNKGSQSVDEYIKQTAIINPHVTIIYTDPKSKQFIFPRATDQLPAMPKEIKPHPYGVELGILMRMLQTTEARTLQSFLTTEFSRVGPGTAKQICENAALLPNTKPKSMSHAQVEKLMEGIKKTKLVAPPTDCISPITAELLEKGIRKEINAEFYYATTRPPAVYRGNPFVIEAAIAYGGEIPADGSMRLLRFANRVPLLYQQGACAVTEAVTSTNWRGYGLQQSNGNMPQGPVVLVVHMASVWVPFTSEAKEAIAHYPEIIKEVKLAIQECGRNLARYVLKKKRVKDELKKRSYIEIFIPHVGEALKDLLKLKPVDESRIEENLKEILEKKRGKIEKLDFDPTKNKDYDEELAKFGKEEPEKQTDNEEEAGTQKAQDQ